MTLSWLSIVRLGLVQMCLGAVVVLMTSTLNRLMVVELSLAATIPGALVAIHYLVQISRPKWGFLSDIQGNRTKWIILGMIILAVGANLAALCIPLYSFNATAATILSFFAYTLIGIGVGASGTSLLALLASHTIQHRRAAAATITWLMMIFGIAVTATVVGKLLEPYSVERLIKIVFGLTVVTVTITFISTLNIERGLPTVNKNINKSQSFLTGLKVIWANSQTKRFSVFVFLSMTAYFMQELILEPYAGIVFSFTPGQSTSLSGMQNGGVFLGMLAVGIACTGFKFGALKNWVWAGCMGSCISLVFIALAGQSPEIVPLAPLVFALGIFNGMFAVAAIGSMMSLASQNNDRREGTRMGLWGAAQAIAAGFGGLLGTILVDLLQLVNFSHADAYGTVFIFEAALFALAASIATRSITTAFSGTTQMVGE
ncbi:BCD family MFS transporter [Paracoccaceae bacterium]|nr:BCD family MFS transporter [Paracoccaceae bacterium]